MRDKLIEKGCSVFFDENEIPGGSTFPRHLAKGLVESRMVIVFATETYFSKPWCVLEFQSALGPYRNSVNKSKPAGGLLDRIMILLPSSGPIDKISALLPPPLSVKSWLKEDQTEAAAAMALGILNAPAVAKDKLTVVDDPFTESLLNGGLVPWASKSTAVPNYLYSLPESLKEQFIGRAEKLWEIYNGLELKAAADANRAVVIEASAGMGKTQLAAEYVWRYGFRYYEGGIVWIDAGSDEEQLAAQFKEVIMALSKGIQPANTLQQLSTQLQQCFNSIPADKKILWVVDNIPEPGKGTSPKRLDYWCPVRNKVSLLGTSRQAGIKDADTIIALTELTEDAAVDLLVQPPVDEHWLSEENWKKTAKWVGYLPLALRILHTSLGDHYLSADTLMKKVNGEEPAIALDEEVDSIKEEVAEGYVRSIAELFHFSFEALRSYAQAFRMLKTLSQIAVAPVPEKLLLLGCEQRDLGILLKRSWINVSEDPKHPAARQYSLHRITASYVKGNSAAADFIFTGEWFEKIFSTPLSKEELTQAERQFRVFSTKLATKISSGQDEPLRARALKTGIFLAQWKQDDFDTGRGLRFTAANFLDAIGGDTDLIEIFLNTFETASENAARNMICTASGLYNSAGGAEFLKRAFEDKRDLVRWQAFVQCSHSSRGDILLEPFLQALMKETNKNIVENNSLAFGELLRHGRGNGLRALLSSVAHFLMEQPGALHRKMLATILGSILEVFGNSWTAGGWKAEHVISMLLPLALDDPEESVRDKAAKALAAHEDKEVAGNILSALLQSDTATYRNHIRALLVYIHEFEQPPAGIQIMEEDGSLSLVANMEGGKARPDLYEPLISQVIDGQDESKLSIAIDEIMSVRNALFVLTNKVHQLQDQGNHEAVIRIAGSMIRVRPEHPVVVNSYWWRGLALYHTQQFDKAIADLAKTIELNAAFSDAYYYRALCYENTDKQAFFNDLCSAIKIEAKHYQALYKRAWHFYETDDFENAILDIEVLISLAPANPDHYNLKASCLIKLQRYEEAIAAEENALRINDQYAEYWFMKGIAHYQLSQMKYALAALESAQQLDPGNNSVQQLIDYIKSSGEYFARE